MSDRFQPMTMKQFTRWVFTELDQKQALFGIPKDLFFTPKPADPFRTAVYEQPLETPFGVAAGPHTQMAQNLIAAWLCGARFMELKTIQTLDELDVPKPCIDMQDEGYNVEWSQELKIQQSFDEYLRAWILIHALHRKLGFPGEAPGLIFNMSVGYNYDGVLKDNVQEFLRNMQDAGERYEQYVEETACWFPEVRDLNIPRKLSDNATLSTMHGCPPAEIGKIAAYLIEEWGFHTNVKLNPTLLGPERLRGILNETLGFNRVTVPDEAFGHDLKYPDALNLLNDLQARADQKGVTFGVKLSNTLECENHRDVFNPKEKMMYLSGRPLQAVTANLAAQLSGEFKGHLLMSYAGGADAFCVADLLASGMSTITVSSDLLKSGGYMRMIQYIEETEQAMTQAGAATLPDFIRARCTEPCTETSSCALSNLNAYARRVLEEPRLHQDAFERQHTKTARALDMFDCIHAPCANDCPIHQQVPRYMQAVKEGDYARAIDVVRADNSMPTVLGRACTHVCETVCVRSHYDEPLAIREMKRFIMDQEKTPRTRKPGAERKRTIGIVGAGPCGLAAADFLRRAGFPVTLFEEREYSGGMVQGTIPGYRATQQAIDQDMNTLRQLGAEFRFGQKAGRDFQVADLLQQFDYVIMAAGAQKSMMMDVPGEQAEGVYECLDFLRRSRHSEAPKLGARVGVIGGGDVAMDCARTAKRLSGGSVQVIYRRTRREMPAEQEEIKALFEEGIEILELAAPVEVKAPNGRITALRCIRMELGAPDESGRRRPVPVPGSEFDLPLDALIVAIGQRPDFDFLEGLDVSLNRKGYIDVHETTLETSVPNLFAGGDAVQAGPTTIVKAFGDGKIIAQTILKRDGQAPETEPTMPVADWADMMRRRAKRQFRVPVPELHASQRGGFDEVIQTLDEETAQQEAARCLGCDEFCSLCATVCPNRAIQTYRCEPIERQVPEVKLHGAVVDVMALTTLRVTQPWQVLVQTDFCNECGNCRTFCPTAGAPYQQKPRLYLQPAEFAAEENNAFMLIQKGDQPGIRGKYNGDVRELTLTAKGLSYSADSIRFTLNEETFEILDAAVDLSPQGGDHHMSLTPCFEMYVLLKNIRASLPYLPVHGINT
ncbi:MAG: putative selenate reductase subunit YgfK [Kiritimatiellae bacterium]|nr:putative selenate reductase subunit YgfK [Kiritimatiellia bacterium]